MSHLSKKCLLTALFLPTCAVAQNVDRTKYKDYSYPPPPDPSLMCTRTVKAQSVRPDHVNNGENIYFPPVFNRDGGSCGSERLT